MKKRNDPGVQLVGKRVGVRWPQDGKYYAARVLEYDSQKKKHLLVYEDCVSIEHVKLSHRGYKNLPPTEDEKNPRSLIGRKIKLEIKVPKDPKNAPRNFIAIVVKVAQNSLKKEDLSDGSKDQEELDSLSVFYDITYIKDEYNTTTDIWNHKFSILNMHSNEVEEEHNQELGPVVVDRDDSDDSLSPITPEKTRSRTKTKSVKTLPWVQRSGKNGRKGKEKSETENEPKPAVKKENAEELDTEVEEDNEKKPKLPPVSRVNDPTLFTELIGKTITINEKDGSNSTCLVIGSHISRNSSNSLHRVIHLVDKRRETVKLAKSDWKFANIWPAKTMLGKRLSLFDSSNSDHYEAFVVSIVKPNSYLVIRTFDDQLYKRTLSDDGDDWDLVSVDEDQVDGCKILCWKPPSSS